jgi:predicted DNA-binding transcriptional regulator AlpA
VKLQIIDGRKTTLEIDYDIGDYIGRPEACLITGASDTKLRSMIQNGQFPSPVPMSDGSHGFALEDVVAWGKSMDDHH